MSEPWVRFEDEAEAKGFALISNAVMRDPSLTMQAKYLYGLLKSFAWQDATTYPGVKTLCGAAGVSKDTLSKYLSELVERGLIEVKRRGQGKTNLYIFKRIRPNPDGDTGSHQESDTSRSPDGDPSRHNEDAVNEDSVTALRGGAVAPAGKDKRQQTPKPVPPGKFGVAALVEARGAAKRAGRDPIPLDNRTKQTFGQHYAAYIEQEDLLPEDLEPAIEMMVECACGKGPESLTFGRGKARWPWLTDVVEHLKETGRPVSLDERREEREKRERAEALAKENEKSFRELMGWE